MTRLILCLLAPAFLLLASCASSTYSSRNPVGTGGGTPNMGPHPSPDFRQKQIANEQSGNFYYGRRYHVQKTRFWGYLRQPRQPWSKAQLVIFNERSKKQPDRLPEYGPAGARYGFDQNYEYRIRGRYTGRTLYEPNSNQFLPEFQLTGYELLNKDPGWLFSPNDHYDPLRLTLLPR
ncbi:MAG: hypothetical protein ACQKBY_05120 [Verrucomicrobiales bacterium]